MQFLQLRLPLLWVLQLIRSSFKNNIANTWRLSSGWYRSDLYVATIDITICSTLAPRRVSRRREIGVGCQWPGGDSLLHVGVFCKSHGSRMLLQGSKEMEVTGREVGAVGWVFRNLAVVAQ